jgi:hypothetical protein
MDDAGDGAQELLQPPPQLHATAGHEVRADGCQARATVLDGYAVLSRQTCGENAARCARPPYGGWPAFGGQFRGSQ